MKILGEYTHKLVWGKKMNVKTFLFNTYTDNYLPPFSKDLFRQLANCFLLLDCVNIPDTIGWFSKDLIESRDMGLGMGDIQLFNPFPPYSNIVTNSKI